MRNTLALVGAQGTTFDNNFVTLSLCCPSRSTFLTGQYAHNHGVLTNGAPDGGFAKLDHTNTLAVLLQKAGYNTALVCKYLNGYKLANGIPPGWTEFHAGVNLRAAAEHALLQRGGRVGQSRSGSATGRC